MGSPSDMEDWESTQASAGAFLLSQSARALRVRRLEHGYLSLHTLDPACRHPPCVPPNPGVLAGLWKPDSSKQCGNRSPCLKAAMNKFGTHKSKLAAF